MKNWSYNIGTQIVLRAIVLTVHSPWSVIANRFKQSYQLSGWLMIDLYLSFHIGLPEARCSYVLLHVIHFHAKWDI